jgi:dihydroxyacetone kinase-like protein
MQTMATADFVAWVRAFSQSVEEGQARLTELDAATGDADHGANLRRGVLALSELVATDRDPRTPGEFLKQVGLRIVDSVGGSSGALYGTMFLRMAAAVGPEARAIDGAAIAKALRAATQGIVDRGRARPGDKTMLDAMGPAAEAFAVAIGEGRGLAAAWRDAAHAAARGAQATKAMRARRGKSSYVGEKSVGAVDPGAASVAMLIASAAQVVGGESGFLVDRT